MAKKSAANKVFTLESWAKDKLGDGKKLVCWACQGDKWTQTGATVSLDQNRFAYVVTCDKCGNVLLIS